MARYSCHSMYGFKFEEWPDLGLWINEGSTRKDIPEEMGCDDTATVLRTGTVQRQLPNGKGTTTRRNGGLNDMDKALAVLKTMLISDGVIKRAMRSVHFSR